MQTQASPKYPLSIPQDQLMVSYKQKGLKFENVIKWIILRLEIANLLQFNKNKIYSLEVKFQKRSQLGNSKNGRQVRERML